VCQTGMMFCTVIVIAVHVIPDSAAWRWRAPVAHVICAAHVGLCVEFPVRGVQGQHGGSQPENSIACAAGM
jgi:hypothetical protein